jgi:uncharacterized OsmC-like protein
MLVREEKNCINYAENIRRHVAKFSLLDLCTLALAGCVISAVYDWTKKEDFERCMNVEGTGMQSRIKLKTKKNEEGRF